MLRVNINISFGFYMKLMLMYFFYCSIIIREYKIVGWGYVRVGNIWEVFIFDF